MDALVHTTGVTAALDHWQTLVGAALGGVSAVVAALIVAVMVARRERRIAASMVLPEVQRLAAAQLGLSAYLDHWAVTEQPERNTAMCRHLVEQRPQVTALYTPMLGQLSDIDARLYSHLFQCQMTHQAFERELATFEEHDKVFLEREKRRSQESRAGPRPRQVADPDHLHLLAMLGLHGARAVRGWTYCVEHAELANYFLDRFVFNRWPNTWHRLRMRLCPNALDRRSAKLLATGQLSESGEQQ
jgi:hypothetical protein